MKVYDSGELTELAYGNPLTVNHGLGYIPSVYAVYRVEEGVDKGWASSDPEDPEAPLGVYVDSFDENNAVIKQLEGYTFSGNVRLVCFHGN